MGFLDFLFRPPSLEKFAQQFVKEMRRAGVTDPLTIDIENERILRGASGEPQIIGVGNFYREHLSLERGQRRQHLQQRARMFSGPGHEFPDDFETARSHLRPKLWCRAVFSKLRLQSQIDGGDPDKLDIPEYEVGSHLIASLVYDLPDQMASVSKEQLEKWGVTYYEALEIARENLEQEPFTFAKIGDGCYASATGDSYDSCRLLLPSLIEKFEVKGDLIALVPSRDSLIVAGSEDEQSLQIMLDLGKKELETNPRPMVPIPLRYDGDDWLDWLPPKNHRLAGPFQELAVSYLIQEYGEQQQLLNQVHEKGGIDVFVATYNAVQKDDGTIYSYGTWGNGFESLLPKTDWITFVRDDGDVPANAPWSKVQEIVGHLLSPTDHYPERFHVKAFPSDEELAALGDENP